jgi:hypothetical protein
MKHCQPLGRYLQEVKLLVAKYGKREHIYLATDDADVASEAVRQQSFEGMRLVTQPALDRRKYEDIEGMVTDCTMT